ncbi:MAG TPA: glycoside hydrolase family 9 protein, partial [Herpetosiphonaceae bacterium]|nr:glycoside hydrolase family 9 protein [Herpetosiphonaceae bacterium]
MAAHPAHRRVRPTPTSRLTGRLLAGLMLCLILAACANPTLLSLMPARSAALPPSNLLINGDFSAGFAPWWSTATVAPDASSGELAAAITNGGANPWDAIVGQNNIALQQGQVYTIELDLRASTPLTIILKLQQEGPPYAGYFQQNIPLTTGTQHFQYVFTAPASDEAAAFQFQIGGLGNHTIYLDNAQLIGGEAEPPVSDNLVKNGDFGGGLSPWWTGGALTTDLSDGACLTITNGGSNPWDVQIGQHNIPTVLGKTYLLEFDARATQPVTIQAKLQENGDDYTTYFGSAVPLTPTMRHVAFSWTSAYSDPVASLVFQLGGLGTPTICLDNVALKIAATGIRLNQTGYQPAAPKIATIVHPSLAPLAWELRNAANTVVLSGTTTVYGFDAAAGEHVHQADFSAARTPGAGYTLRVGADTSHPFEISRAIYHGLKYDALAYFYHNRSGITLTLPYAGGAQWTRPAGHIGVAPNKGDTSVTCFQGIDAKGKSWPGCDYSLDVRGGWYDAGDHGKYVVNGGISVWTLLNQYERSQALGRAAGRKEFADGALNIPEKANGVPDILDEARWQLEFMLAMQIPASTGISLTGMVHHKVHDASWTGLALPPHMDPQQRYLYPPSTAATLNLAATAAQCSRIWRTIDAAFANRCLAAAETAWDAALAHPAEFARDNFVGGGPYDDTQLSDEFYWAAAELYATTGAAEYKTAIAGSGHFLALPVTGGESMSWGGVAALGTITLAVVPNGLTAAQHSQARANIVAAANGYRATLAGEGYRTPFAPGGAGLYPWGSNSSVLNNMIIMALAFDFTANPAYADAVSEAMDYLLGRNAMDKSYVS